MFCKDFSVTHIKWDDIISSSLRLLLKMWICYRYQNRIENYTTMMENGYVFIKKYISTHRPGCSCNLYICKKRRIPIYLTKLYSKERQMPYSTWRKWLKWIVIENVNSYFPILLPERNCARTFSKFPRGKSNRVYSEKMKTKAWRRMCERGFFVNLQVDISQLHYRLTSSQIIFRYFKYMKAFK